MLTPGNAVPYLLQRNLIRAEAIVQNSLTIADVSRRNCNLKVTSKPGPSYLLKQGIGPKGEATVAHEATMYQFLKSEAKRDGLNNDLPHFYGYDAENHILILELLPDAQTLSEYHILSSRFSVLLARVLGNTLAKLHRLTWEGGKGTRYEPHFLSQPAWILSVHRPSVKELREISSANLQLIRIIQSSTELCEALDGLRQEWRAESLIHYDIKWDNCIVYARPGSKRRTRLKIVDWELAGIGDPCWDAGSVFHTYLSYWLASIPIMGTTTPAQLLDLAPYPLETMHPPLRSFWQSYVRRMNLDADQSNPWLVRSVKYGAARLLQTAYEQMHLSSQLTRNVICLLQLSLNIMKRPEEAAVHLLGIPLLR